MATTQAPFRPPNNDDDDGDEGEREGHRILCCCPPPYFSFLFFLRPPTGVRNPEKHFEKIYILTLSLKHEERDAHTEEGQTLVMKGKY